MIIFFSVIFISSWLVGELNPPSTILGAEKNKELEVDKLRYPLCRCRSHLLRNLGQVRTNFADMCPTDDPNLIVLRDTNLIVREWAQMSPEKLFRDLIPRAGLLTLTDRGLPISTRRCRTIRRFYRNSR